MIRRMLVKLLVPIFVITVFMLCFASRANSQKSNFSGSWVVNLPESDLGGAPSYTAIKRLTVQQKEDTIAIERSLVKSNGEEYLAKEILKLDGKISEHFTLSKRKKIISTNWSEDGTEFNEIATYTLPEDNSKIDYKVIEKWKLSLDGEKLTIIRTTELPTHNYTITALYNKE